MSSIRRRLADMLGLIITASVKRKLPRMYRMFEQFSGISAFAFAQGRHRHPHDLQLMLRYFTFVCGPMRALALSLRTITSPLKFSPHVVHHTLKRLQFFMPTEFSQRRHALLKSFKDVL